MASNYVHELTAIEEACGITLEAVADVLLKGAFFDSGRLFAIPDGTPPALASSVARCAFGGAAEFSHISRAAGYIMYRATE